jgi:hypothetical protein
LRLETRQAQCLVRTWALGFHLPSSPRSAPPPGMLPHRAYPDQECGDGLRPPALPQARTAQLPAYTPIPSLQQALARRLAESGYPARYRRVHFAAHLCWLDPPVAARDRPYPLLRAPHAPPRDREASTTYQPVARELRFLDVRVSAFTFSRNRSSRNRSVDTVTRSPARIVRT